MVFAPDLPPWHLQLHQFDHLHMRIRAAFDQIKLNIDMDIPRPVTADKVSGPLFVFFGNICIAFHAGFRFFDNRRANLSASDSKGFG